MPSASLSGRKTMPEQETNYENRPSLRISCDCGSDTFWIAGIPAVLVCTHCGARTPIGFSITG